MQIIRSVILLMLAGLLAGALAETPVVSNPPVFQTLPDMLDADTRALLGRGEYEAVRQRCESEIESHALVADPGVLARPYQGLAEALYGLKNYEAAVLAYTNAIDQLERSAGVFDPRLVQVFEGLGQTFIRLGKLDAAEDALIKAKDLTHRNFGIYNLVQSSIVNRLTKTYYHRGDLSDASREQKFLLRAHEETYGEAPQLLPAIRRMAKWHERTGRYDLARDNYRRALTIMKRAYGPNDLRLVGPLRDFARSYLNTPRGASRVMSRAGSKALMDVIDLYERQEFTDAVDLASSWSDLGDWYVIGGRRSAARKAYSEAGKVLQSVDVDASKDMALFSHPVEIEYEDVPIGLRASRLRALPDGIAILEFEFTVNAEGRVTNLVVMRDDLNYTRFALEVGQRIKASRYRPRIVDGQPVATAGVRKTLRYDLTSRLPAEPQVTKVNSGDVPTEGNENDDRSGNAETRESESVETALQPVTNGDKNTESTTSDSDD